MRDAILRMEYNSPVGKMILAEYKGRLIMSDWKYRRMRKTIDTRIEKALGKQFYDTESPLLLDVKSQLDSYFAGSLKKFDLPLEFIGTEFQKSVWNVLASIPFGESKSYLELSRILGDEKAIRAVASANGANALSIIIPCHRIIGSDGSLVGYAGGLNAKRKLLSLEGALTQTQLEF